MSNIGDEIEQGYRWYERIANFLYERRKRNEALNIFLKRNSNISEEIAEVKADVSSLHKSFDELKNNVDKIDRCLDFVKNGTKMELFDTLHNCWQKLTKRGWASVEEKKNVEQIFLIYNHELGGNGNGVKYYNEIVSLPEWPQDEKGGKQ